mmetsp:Transcript_10936/g.30610  ORF Transcript_10936/g.30610 Transcript_10936/m.30610 type:complete len:535 (-) Transcript_10936:119-1723(-)
MQAPFTLRFNCRTFFQANIQKKPIEDPIPEPPEGDNRHPLLNTPWYYQMFVTVKRAVHLIRVFTPFFALSIWISFTSDPEWRQYWLDEMIRTLESAGCSFMKFGQWLSMRPDLLPQDVIKALGRLRNDAPSHTYEWTRRAIRESFGCEIEEIFDYFDPSPVASGTIAQVHRGILKPHNALSDGNLEVAVKVRHPGILEESFVDTRLLFEALDVIGRLILNTSQPFDKDAFNKALQRQVDLKWEAYNLQIFAWNFGEEKDIVFPKVSSHLVSPSVLIETWVSGKIIHDLFADVEDHMVIAEHHTSQAFHTLAKTVMEQRQRLAKMVFDMNIKMFLRDNFIHGDLHGGNLMAADNGTLAVFDAGLTTALRPDTAQPFGYFLQALCVGRVDRVVEKLIEFSDEKSRQRADLDGLRRDVEGLLGQFVGDGGMRSPNGEPINMGEMVGSILSIMQTRRLQLRGDVAVTLMTMAISESLIRSLDPDFDLVKEALPYFVRYRSWRPHQVDLNSHAWEAERQAVNNGLPVHASYTPRETVLT